MIAYLIPLVWLVCFAQVGFIHGMFLVLGFAFCGLVCDVLGASAWICGLSVVGLFDLCCCKAGLVWLWCSLFIGGFCVWCCAGFWVYWFASLVGYVVIWCGGDSNCLWFVCFWFVFGVDLQVVALLGFWLYASCCVVVMVVDFGVMASGGWLLFWTGGGVCLGAVFVAFPVGRNCVVLVVVIALF